MTGTCPNCHHVDEHTGGGIGVCLHEQCGCDDTRVNPLVDPVVDALVHEAHRFRSHDDVWAEVAALLDEAMAAGQHNRGTGVDSPETLKAGREHDVMCLDGLDKGELRNITDTLDPADCDWCKLAAKVREHEQNRIFAAVRAILSNHPGAADAHMRGAVYDAIIGRKGTA